MRGWEVVRNHVHGVRHLDELPSFHWIWDTAASLQEPHRHSESRLLVVPPFLLFQQLASPFKILRVVGTFTRSVKSEEHYY